MNIDEKSFKFIITRKIVVSSMKQRIKHNGNLHCMIRDIYYDNLYNTSEVII